MVSRALSEVMRVTVWPKFHLDPRFIHSLYSEFDAPKNPTGDQRENNEHSWTYQSVCRVPTTQGKAVSTFPRSFASLAMAAVTCGGRRIPSFHTVKFHLLARSVVSTEKFPRKVT